MFLLYLKLLRILEEPLDICKAIQKIPLKFCMEDAIRATDTHELCGHDYQSH